MYCSYDFEQYHDKISESNTAKRTESSIGKSHLLDIERYEELHNLISDEKVPGMVMEDKELDELVKEGVITECSVDNCPIFARKFRREA